MIYHPLHAFVIERETIDGIEGYFKDNINPFSDKMKDRIRRAGLLDKVPKEMLG